MSKMVRWCSSLAISVMFAVTAVSGASVPGLADPVPWRVSTIDMAGDVGLWTSLALDSNDNVHISYYDSTHGNLKYATNAGGMWTGCTIDQAKSVGLYTSLALDSNDKVHISYYDAERGDLKYATNAGGSWATVMIDSKGDVGGSTSIAIDSSNKVHISYLDSTDFYLKYATNAGGSWMTYKVDRSSTVGEGTSIAIDSGDGVHISYLGFGSPKLKYATNAGGSWTISIVDSGSWWGAGGWSSIALDSNDRVHISYYEYGAGYVKYATNCGGSWTTSRVDDCSDSPWTSIAIDSVDKVHISYSNNWISTYRYLMYATNSEGSWAVSTVDSVGVDCTSLAIDSCDRVHIGYNDCSRHDLKYATNAGPPPAVSLVLYNGTVVTMEEDMPVAQAIAVKDDCIVAVGTNEDILALVEAGTRIIDLEGRTVLPGFIDSHSHALTSYEHTYIGAPYETGQRWVNTLGNGDSSVKEATPQDQIRVALKGGWTSISEMCTNQWQLDFLLALDNAGELKVRVNTYLQLNNYPVFDPPQNWYTAYPPGHEYSSKLRIGGVKIFADEEFYGRFVLLSQEYLTHLVSKAHSEGYQIAIHAMDKGIDLVLNTYQQVLQGEQDSACRDRIEHFVVVRDDQLSRIAQMGLIPSFQMTWFTSNPWYVWDVKKYIGLDRVDLVGRWHNILEAGILSIGGTDFPYIYDTDNSAMAAIYKAVTRIGEPGLPVPQWELDQRITVEQALRLLTIDAAYGTFQEDVKGSIAVGKFADLVVLSDNPLAIPPARLMNISVLMTMVGGQVEYCAPGHEYLYGSVCPTSLASVDYGTFSNTALATPTDGLVVASEAVASFKENV